MSTRHSNNRSADDALPPPPPASYPGIGNRAAIAILGIAIAVFFWKILLRKAFFWEDFLIQAFPFRNFAAVSLREGELPLWNPYAFSGMPFQADIQSALFYVPNLLLTAFTGGGYLSFYAMELALIAHYWLAAVGMYFLAREFRLEPQYALFASLVFALSGFMIVHAIHPGFVQHVAWIPWIVLLLERSIARRSAPYALATGLVAGHAVLAGAPQISLYLVLLLLAYSVFAIFARGAANGSAVEPADLRFPAIAFAVALGVAAVQLLPTIELAPLSQRSEITAETSQGARLEWRQLLTAVIPRYFGASGARGSTYWAPGIYGSYWETTFYWGIPALFAAAFGLTLMRRNRVVVFFAATVAVSLLLAVGDQFVLHRLFTAVVPGYDKFRAVARIMVLATFAVALLGAFGLRAFIVRCHEKPRSCELMAMAALAAVLCIWGAAQMGVFLPPQDAPDFADIRSLSMREARAALMFSVGAALIGAGVARRRLPPLAAVGAVCLLQFGDMARFGIHQNTGAVDAQKFFHESNEVQRFLVRHLKEAARSEHFRVTVRKSGVLMLSRNQGMVDRIELTDGYTALALRRLVPPAPDYDARLDLLNSKYRIVVDTADGTIAMELAPGYMPRAFVVHAAAVLPDDRAIEARMRSPSFDPRRTVILEEEPALPLPPSSDNPPGVVRIDEYRLNSIRMRASMPRPGAIVLSEIHYPGWNAYVNGDRQPVHRANWNLRAVVLDAGTHDVELRFEPWPFRLGAGITIVTLLVAGTVLLRGRRGSSPTLPG